MVKWLKEVIIYQEEVFTFHDKTIYRYNILFYFLQYEYFGSRQHHIMHIKYCLKE